MPRALVLFAHADPSVRAKYEETLQRYGVDADLVFCNNFVTGQLSAAYDALAAQLTDARGRVLPRLLGKFPPPQPLDSYDAVIAASFSAGYAIWRKVLGIPADVAELAGYVGIDSFHAALDADGTANDQQLAGLVSMAIAAKDGPRVCWYGHTDVATPQKSYRDPKTGKLISAYASTTQVAAELVRLAGGEGGGFNASAYNLDADQTKEHGHALTAWGPQFLALAVLEALARKGLPGATPAPYVGPLLSADLAEAAVRWALAEAAAGHNEEPRGSNAGQWVKMYLEGGERNGVRPVVTSGDWCAGAASASAFLSRPGARVPHRWRVSVLELWQDACSAEFQSARSVELVRKGLYRPKRGDLAILTRGGGAANLSAKTPAEAFTSTKGKGHVGRLTVDVDGTGNYTRIDGNAGPVWDPAVKASIYAPELVGFIDYSGTGEATRAPSDLEIAGLSRLLQLQGDIAAGNIGVRALDAVMARGVA